jgi:hypothetical protein
MNVIFRKRGTDVFAILPAEATSRKHINEIATVDFRGVMGLSDYYTAMNSSSPARPADYQRLKLDIERQYATQVRPQLRRLEGFEA